MPPKIVNVVYKVDDSELTKAKATIQGNQTATKQAEAAMTSYGQSAQQTGGIISNTIFGMTQKMQQLKAQIELTTQTDVAKIDRLKAEYQNLKQKVDDFNKSLNDTNASGQSSIGVFQGLRDAITTALSVAAVRQLGTMILNMNELAGKVQTVDAAFRRAFPNATLLLNNLRTATHGTVTDYELMQRTLQATNLGVSVEHLATLFEFAAARAQQTGESVDYLVDSIVRGIGRKSVLVLDNLGLSTTRLKQQFNGAAIASKSVAEVTEGVAAIAKVELEKMGGYVETSETKVKQLTVSWTALQQQIAKTAQSSGFVGFLNDLVTYFRRGISSSEQLREEFATTFATKEVDQFLKSQKLTNEELDKEIKLRKERLQNLQNERSELIKRSTSTQTDPFDPFTKKQVQREDVKKVTDQMQETIDIRTKSIELLEAEAKRRQLATTAEQKETGIIEVLNDKLKNLRDELEKATSIDAAGRINQQIAVLERTKKAVENASPLNLNVDEAKNDASDLENLLRQTYDDINKDAEESYKEGLNLLKKADSDAQKERESAMAIQNARQKEQDDKEKADAKAKADYKKRLEQQALNTGLQGLQDVLYATLINRQDDLSNLSDYYQAKIDAAGNNQKEVDRLRKEQAKAEDAARIQQLQADKDAAITKIEIDTAVNIIRSIMNNGGIPLGIPFGLLAAAAGAIQVATVQTVTGKSLRTRAFAEGEVNIDGPGTSTSDSIPVRISKGESVINAEATSRSMLLLEAINDRKIDDRILQQIALNGGHTTVNMDTKSIVDAIERNRVDYAKQGYTLMETHQVSSNFRRYIRSKVQGY